MDPISSPSEHDVLIVVDVQNDFCPSGALAVPGGGEVATIASRLGSRFANVVLTQDWHSEGHLSFASSHQGKSPYETIDMPYGPQVLWPDHCVQGTDGAAFHADLDIPHAAKIIQKGFRPEIDSYSAFFDNDRQTPTELSEFLRGRGWSRVFLCGLATDFCVHYSALDARAEGFETAVIIDACRAIDLDGSLGAAMAAMDEAGVAVMSSAELSGY